MFGFRVCWFRVFGFRAVHSGSRDFGFCFFTRSYVGFEALLLGPIKH